MGCRKKLLEIKLGRGTGVRKSRGATKNLIRGNRTESESKNKKARKKL